MSGGDGAMTGPTASPPLVKPANTAPVGGTQPVNTAPAGGTQPVNTTPAGESQPTNTASATESKQPANLTPAGAIQLGTGEDNIDAKPVKDEPPLVIKYVNGLSRILGLITIAILVWATADTVHIVDQKTLLPIEAYLIFLCVVVIFLEGIWYMDFLVCCQRTGWCCKIWSALLWIDTWKKGILYIGISVPCFAIDVTVVLAVVAGVLLDVTALACICVALKHCECCKKPWRAPPIVKETENLRSSLVKHDGNAATYDSTETQTPSTDVNEHSTQTNDQYVIESFDD